MGIALSIFSKPINLEMSRVCFYCHSGIDNECYYSYDNKHCSLSCAEKTTERMESLYSHIEVQTTVARLSPIPAPIADPLLRFDAVELCSSV